MKKVVSLLLALALLMGATSAMALTITPNEASQTFDLEITIPEGAKTEESEFGEIHITAIRPEGGNAPQYQMVIAPEEEYGGKNLSDLTQEELGKLVADMKELMVQPTVETLTMADGNLLIVLNEDQEQNDFASAYTMYDGYVVSMYVAHEDDHDKLTDDETNAMVQMMQSLKVLPVTK